MANDLFELVNRAGLPIDALSELSRQDMMDFEPGGRTWQLYRQACADNFFFAAKFVISSKLPEENRISINCHWPLALVLQKVNEGEILRLLIEDPRKHLKSTLATVARPIHKLMVRAVRGEPINDRFALRSWSKEMAQKFWREIKWCFENNQLFQTLFPELIPDFTSVVWNETEGVVGGRTSGVKDLTFTCLSRTSAGTAFSDVTEDDMVNEENYKSPTAIEEAIDAHRLLKNLLDNDPNNPPVSVTVGNDWGSKDLNWYIREKEPDVVVFSRADTGPNLEEPWANCRLLPPSVMELLQKMPQGQPIWPETFSLDRLAQIQRENGLRIYLAHWKNRPSDPEAQEFQPEWLKRAELVEAVVAGRKRLCLRYEDDSQPVPLAACNLYLTWDPALGGPTGESDNAILLTSMDWKGRAAVIREYAAKENPLKTLDVFVDFCLLYSRWLTKVGVEDVVFSKVLGDLVHRRLRDRGVYIRVEPLKIPRDIIGKDRRIRAAVGLYAESGRLYVLDRCPKLKEQYGSFGVPRAKRDLMDILSHATRIWRTGERPEGYLAGLDDPLDEEGLDMGGIVEDLGISGYGQTLAV